MLLAGAAILTALVRHRAKSPRIAVVLATGATVLMMLGYVEVIRRSGEILQTTC